MASAMISDVVKENNSFFGEFKMFCSDIIWIENSQRN